MSDELLETFRQDGQFTGLVPRARVHGEGYWHCAVHVWLFDATGRVYIQRRSEAKDTNPGLWDVSVGEHLQPGEDYATAARRGLMEELGLQAGELADVGGPRPVITDEPSIGIYDREYQTAFTAVTAVEPVPETDEVAALRAVTPEALLEWLATSPGDFTPGFHRDVADFGLLGDPR